MKQRVWQVLGTLVIGGGMMFAAAPTATAATAAPGDTRS